MRVRIPLGRRTYPAVSGSGKIVYIPTRWVVVSIGHCGGLPREYGLTVTVRWKI